MASLSVRDLMTETVRAVRDDDDLALVYDMMAGGNFRHVPVVDADGTLVGLVTHRDLLRGALGQALELPVSVQRELLRQMKVRDIMIHEPDSVEPDTNLAEAAELMMMHKLGCLPVVDGDQLVGILTESDFVRHVVEAA
jgi:CBS domain-containing membrane protein